MDKKSKEAIRRYKRSRKVASSSDSSSSDSDSGSSSSGSSSTDSEKRAAERHRKKKLRQAISSVRRSSSTSPDERRRREQREHCQKLEAKRNHLKRKLKEAKLKKRAAAAAAALSGHSHRALSPATQAKLKKLAERKHQRAASKERREREKEKHRAALREREREHHRASRSPTKITKIRIHQDVKRQKSPPRMHQQLMSREKIIIQTRTRERTPSVERERQRHEHKLLRHDDMTRDRDRRDRDRERAEREAARDKERAEALARCQERQRERERLAREKLRREEEEKKYGGSLVNERGERLMSRGSDRDLGSVRGYSSRERSLEAVERARHVSKRDIDVYEREREYLEAERRGLLDRDELRREREYLVARHRELSPAVDGYGARIRDPRDLYAEEERERVYGRGYLDDGRHLREREPWLDPRDIREREMHGMNDTRSSYREVDHDIIYPDERERLARDRERGLQVRGEWKNEWESREHEWEEGIPQSRGSFVGLKRGGGSNVAHPKIPPPREKRAPSEPNWDADEQPEPGAVKKGESSTRDNPGFSGASGHREWMEHDQREKLPTSVRPPEHIERRWPDWRDEEEGVIRTAMPPGLHYRSDRGGRGGYRRGGLAGILEHGERNPQGPGFRPHPPPLMTLPVQPPGGYHGANPRFPNKRNMTYTNPNIAKKALVTPSVPKTAAQASVVAAATTAIAAAKAAAQSVANSTTNPAILTQVNQGIRNSPSQNTVLTEKPEAGEIVIEDSPHKSEPVATLKVEEENNADKSTDECKEKVTGELSEISDSEDDILNKTEKKLKLEAEQESGVQTNLGELESPIEQQSSTTIVSTEEIVKPPTLEDRAEDEEMLGFEEISDGELEEEARNKGVGDALGVDWASLIAETKKQAENASPNSGETSATAKQKWQPHRVILEVGISLRMAGEEHGKKLLHDAELKLKEELMENTIKVEKTNEENKNLDENTELIVKTIENSNDDLSKDVKPLIETMKTEEELDEKSINNEKIPELACIQVAQRNRKLKQKNLILNACGPNSRALSARQDLELRRQLCDLPAKECDLPRPLPAVNEKLKLKALAVFQRALNVK